MRVLALALIALPALLPTGAAAQATLNKCIDAQGKITYSNLPCRNAQEAQKVNIDPAPIPDPVRVQAVSPQPAAAPAPVAPKAAASSKPAPIHLETRQTSSKPSVRASASQCNKLSDKLGRVLDQMDAARRKGYTLKQMDEWNEDIKDLERKKQQSGCF